MKSPEMYIDHNLYKGKAPIPWHEYFRKILRPNYKDTFSSNSRIFISEWVHIQEESYESHNWILGMTLIHKTPPNLEIRVISVIDENRRLCDLPQGLYTETTISFKEDNTVELGIFSFLKQVLLKTLQKENTDYLKNYIEKLQFLHGMRNSYTPGFNISKFEYVDDEGYIAEHFPPNPFTKDSTII